MVSEALASDTIFLPLMARAYGGAAHRLKGDDLIKDEKKSKAFKVLDCRAAILSLPHLIAATNFQKKLFLGLTIASLADKILKCRINRYAPVAQLDRVTGYEPVGQGFESLPARH